MTLRVLTQGPEIRGRLAGIEGGVIMDVFLFGMGILAIAWRWAAVPVQAD